MQILPLTEQDKALVWRFLTSAAHDSMENVQASPLLACYAQSWGREGDFGLKATQLTDGERNTVGLVWSRLYSADNPAFGFVAPDVPELSIAVEAEARGQRVGQKLLERYIESAKHRFPAVSLNVRTENVVAIQLYERNGFHRIEGSERINRTGGVSFNMLLRF